jgi:DNA polymerase III subunit epsilon
MASESESGEGAAWEQVDLLSFAGPPSAAPSASLPEDLPETSPPLESELDPAGVVEPDPAVEPGPVVQSRERVRLPIVATAPADGTPEFPRSSPQRLLILDTETTGLDPRQHQCIEVGAVLFDVPRRAVLSQISFLLPCDQNPARSVNGIDPEVSRLPQPWPQALECFEAMLAAADVVLAHNAAFDRQWFGQGPLPAIDKPWLCSMEDLRWPAERQLRATPSVRDLALAYGVPVWAAHRALTDCIYLAQVFERCPELERLLQAGLEPRRLYRARLSYEERHKAREAGFRWNEPISGAWSRRLSEQEAALLSFPVVPVEDQGLQRRTA